MTQQLQRFTIGRLARETGCKVKTIRYYEEIGLLPKPERSASNRRLYGPSTSRRLAFIRHSRELGFPLAKVRALLSLADEPEHTCTDVDRVARMHLDSVDRRIQRLISMKEELERMIEECEGGTVSRCRIIEVLADHSLCLTEDHSAPID